jgi:hypothetical protein
VEVKPIQCRENVSLPVNCCSSARMASAVFSLALVVLALGAWSDVARGERAEYRQALSRAVQAVGARVKGLLADFPQEADGLAGEAGLRDPDILREAIRESER